MPSMNIPVGKSARELMQGAKNSISSSSGTKPPNNPIGSLIPIFDQSQGSNVNSVQDSRLNSSRSNDNPLIAQSHSLKFINAQKAVGSYGQNSPPIK